MVVRAVSGIRKAAVVARTQKFTIRCASTGAQAVRGHDASPRAQGSDDIRTRSLLLRKGTPRPRPPRPMEENTGKGKKEDTGKGKRHIPEDIKDRTLWQSWLNLKPRVRIVFGIAAATLAVAGMMFYDKLETQMPPDDSTSEKKPRPKLFGISVVDRPVEKAKA